MYRFVKGETGGHTVSRLCLALGVSRSSYYEFIQRNESSDLKVEQAVIAAFRRHKRRYGSRRLVSELREEGFVIGRKRISSILKKNSLKAIQPRSFVPKTTISHPHLRRSPNLLLDKSEVTSIDKVWVGDITYLPLEGGNWCYMATWLDLYSHHIVGWEIKDHMRESLVLDSFDKAIIKRSPAKGLIVHSDGGSQYGSKRFRNRLHGFNYLQSMTRRNNHYDNASAESLFSRIKAELLEGGIFLSIEEARMECFDYIETYYNPIRRHSSIGNKSPLQFEKECGY